MSNSSIGAYCWNEIIDHLFTLCFSLYLHVCFSKLFDLLTVFAGTLQDAVRCWVSGPLDKWQPPMKIGVGTWQLLFGHNLGEE